MRKVQNLTKGLFHLGDEKNAYYRGYDDSGWQPVTLPHDWSVEHPFDRSYSSGTGYLCGGVGWYRMRFTLPEDIKDKVVWITFGGVYKNSRVWCNTNYLGMRPYGYSTFTHDITAFVEPGENVLAVRAEHTDLADSRWFTGNGIYRDVTITVLESIHFALDEVFTSTVSANEEEAELRIQWKLSGTTKDTKQTEVVFTLRDRDGGIAASAISSGEAGTEILHVHNPMLWSPDSPNLYTLSCSATVNQHTVDELEIACGIRTFAFDAECGFTLNGTSMKLKGVCLHHDAGALGAAVPKAVWKRRLQKLKTVGCNAIRASHNPPDTALLDLCDEMGFLAIDEAFDEWEGCKNKWWQGHNVYPPKHFGYSDAFPVWHERDLSDMVRRDRNHPSIILWSIGNEIDYPNDPYGHPLFAQVTGNNDANKPSQERLYDPNKPNAQRLAAVSRMLAAIVKEHDDTRPVTSALAFPELSNLTGFAQSLDVVGYNYKEHLYREDRTKYSKHVIFGSENGHGEEQWLAVKNNMDICGQFLWTGIDFLGEARGWPVRVSPAGLLTTAGFEKPRYYHRKAMWTDALMVRIATSDMADEHGRYHERFSWDYAAGQTVRVSVYTNAKQIELFLNNCLLGLKEIDEDCYSVSFEVPFEPGELRAVAVRGAECVEDVLVTPSELAEIRLSSEPMIPADGCMADIVQIEVSLFDANGQPIVSRDVMLHYALVGSGEIVGIDNGAADDLTPYTSKKRATFMGQAVVYVRLGEEKVPLTLYVGTSGGVSADIEIGICMSHL